MSDATGRTFHSLKTMQQLKQAALPTHVENFEPPDGVSRRTVLKLMMGASAALAAGLPGCARKPPRKIVSRVKGPEYQKPGRPLYYASTWTAGGFPYGVLLKTVDGRPIKVEGNPDHPINRGTTTAAMQAEILALYDPDRLRGPRQGGQSLSWADADARITAALREARSVVLLTRGTLGPSERALVDEFAARVAGFEHFVCETVHDQPRRQVWREVYGADGSLVPRFDRAAVILSLECDFLAGDEPVLEHVRRFCAGRRLDDTNHQHATMSRLYVAEGPLTLTGSNADERIRVRSSALGDLADSLWRGLRGEGEALEAFAKRRGIDGRRLASLAADLAKNRQRALVVAGGHLPPDVHARVALLNDELQAAGHTLEWNPTPHRLPASDPAKIEAALSAGPDVVICLGVNPVYDLAGTNLAGALQRARLSVAHSLHADETAEACTLTLGSHHNFESWNDASPRPGIESLCQPAIAPLFDTRQEAESLLTWVRALAKADDPIRKIPDYHAWVQQRWFKRLAPAAHGGTDPAKARALAWEECLRRGGLFEERSIPLPKLDGPAAERLAAGPSETSGTYELVVFPHHGVHDGRRANNGWLQELPDPVSKLVWDNAAAMSRKTAEGLKLTHGDLVSISAGEEQLTLPALVQPGMADGVVLVTLGHGRTTGGVVAREAGGVNVAPLLRKRPAAAGRVIGNVQLAAAGGRRKLVRTQKQFSQHDRGIVLDGDLAEFRHAADFVKHKKHKPPQADLYEPVDYKGHKWGMAIDLGACIGCEGCMIACQAENNIPIVGREQCDKGREMHWIRVDRYHDGPEDDPRVQHQPMLCQHCDHAPCENVCPVNATAHSPEGLNEMVYNRCVGTRYCANNCPYKVRRFNFLRFQQAQLRDPVQELMFNPQVTVRGVGVMEKCTFCVQRITAAKHAAADAGTPLPDGSLKTACEQGCPAQAIVFGDLNDPDSRVSKLRASGRAYHVLEELNIKPNVSYLARVRNPHSAASPPAEDSHGRHEA